jgi:hypothetical protein
VFLDVLLGPCPLIRVDVLVIGLPKAPAQEMGGPVVGSQDTDYQEYQDGDED